LPATATLPQFRRTTTGNARGDRSGRASSTLYLDVLRAVAIVLVLLVHAASPVLRDQPVGSIRWLSACVYGSIARCCVPLFIMVSGALLLDSARSEPLATFFRKRATKVVIPWLAWSIVYLFFSAWLARQRLTPLLRHPLTDVEAILAGPTFYHLWFVYVILGLYLATPLLRVFIRAAAPQDLAYFLGLWLAVNSLLPLAGHYLHFDVGLTFYVVEGYVGYFVLGHVLRSIPMRASRRALLYLLCASVAFTIIVTRFLSGRSGALDPTFLDYLAPNIVLMSAATFLFCRDLPHATWRPRRPRTYRALSLLSAASWGIYLLHPLLMETLQHGRLGVRFDGSLLWGVLGIPLVAAAILAASLGLVLAMRRLRLLASVVP
jgi:surface polysaccharide O-acyltransferase-like enzyme